MVLITYLREEGAGQGLRVDINNITLCLQLLTRLPVPRRAAIQRGGSSLFRLEKASFLWSIKYFCVIELESSLKKRSLESSETKEITESSIILKLLKLLNYWSQRTSYKHV